ncbi:MAG: SDR family NAD(P)-dependent oxidoreductase [Paracoccaceae bacterium]|uniref:SDR family NAD(P)-dependent oxidoreductase n=1 Tax=Seohaeicola saemankumensis TaxID=481181 RepID=UPI001E42947C|nr:SDR family oxidoreductase [Seohaeicola saemankumensis]MCD1626433.1 SDR family oxidoreductase [Seohaeicola saemankumensis]
MLHSGKHALVTGGGTGIGLAIAQALAAEGAQVTITGRRTEVLEAVAGNGLHALAMDVMDEAQVVEGIKTAVAARGPIQIVVANAGIAEGKSLQKTDLEFWQRIMRTNLDGAFLTIRESMRGMLDTDWGRVIVVSSLAGLRGLKGAGAYSASKHGVIGLIRSYSEEYMGGPITFNALCPGYVETDIVALNSESIAQRTGMSVEQARQAMADSNRHRRLISVEEVATAAMWLCHPLSGAVNGQCVEIAGGQVR